MPISGWDPIFSVMKTIEGINPKSVLDVGVGTGQWGFLVRNYHDMRYGNFQRNQWKLRLNGIEVCSRYENPAWKLYDTVRIGEASLAIDDLIGMNIKYDVSLMIEVLEHFKKDKGIEVLNNLAKISKHLIFSYANMEQGPAHGNEFEVHRSTWTDEEIKAIFPQAKQIYETGVGKFYHVEVA